MTELATKRRYTEDEIEAGLQAIAIYAGSAKRASEALEAQGLEIPTSTLTNWTRSHAARYHDIRAQRVPELRARMAAQFEDAASQAIEVAQLATEKARQQLYSGANRNPADAAAKLSTAANLLNSNAQLLRGQATHRIEAINATQLLAELSAKLPSAHIDTTAEELQGV